MNLNRIFGFGAVAIVIGGLALAFTYLGTPAHQRDVSIDARRLDDLESVALALHNRYESGGLPGRVPATLGAMDPVTKQPYDFHRVDTRHYVLCASFATYQKEPGDSRDAISPIAEWPHNVGRTCYEFDVTEPPSPRIVGGYGLSHPPWEAAMVAAPRTSSASGSSSATS